MLIHRIALVPLLACLLLGCNRAPPTPPVAPPDPPLVPPQTDPKKEIDEAANVEKDLEQRAVSFLIESGGDAKLQNEIFGKVQALRDVGKEIALEQSGGYGKNGSYYRISPIRDIDAAAAKIDFGRVLAVDPVDRIILVDASAKTAPRPEKGWPGASAIDQYVVRTTAVFFERYPEDLIKKYGRDKVVIVCMPLPGNQEVLKKLKALARDSEASDYFPGSPPFQKPFMHYRVAPIEKVSDVVKALDGLASITADEERRIVIVDLPALKPRPAEVKNQPAPPK